LTPLNVEIDAAPYAPADRRLWFEGSCHAFSIFGIKKLKDVRNEKAEAGRNECFRDAARDRRRRSGPPGRPNSKR